MKTRLTASVIRFALATAALAVLASGIYGAPLGTAFTYHGSLKDSGLPAKGPYDLRCSLYGLETGGSALAGPVTAPSVTVADGAFTVLLDFGASPFAGDARWLEVEVRKSGGPPGAPYTVLTPRQLLTPTPYALYSLQAGQAASVPWSALTSVPAGFADGIDNDTTYSAGAGLTLGGTTFAVASLGILNSMLADNAITAGKISGGEVVKSVNGLKDNLTLAEGANVTIAPEGGGILRISAASGSGGWGLAGNSGTTSANFLGTSDSKPLELRVNATRALRLEPAGTSPNLVGGYQDNLVLPGTVGGTISGGGQLGLANSVTGDFGSVGGGFENVAANLASVSGGRHNLATALHSSIGGGAFNAATGVDATVSGGRYNSVGGNFGSIGGGWGNEAAGAATVAGGTNNLARGPFAVIGGGEGNLASGGHATVAGGRRNTAAGDYSFAGGNRATATHPGSFVWADSGGFFDVEFASTADNQFLIRASGGVGIGTASPTAALDVRDGSGASRDGGGIHVGGVGANGDPKLIHFGDGDFVHLGENGADDTLEFKATRFFFDSGNVGIGTATPTVKLDVVGEARVQVLTITGGADVAEPFQMSGTGIPKGAVMIIDEAHPGKLKLSEGIYDTRVAGIVSGANGVQPGLTLRQEGAIEGGQNVALSGRVYALADAANGPIKPGDLLTTSAMPGHAMKVTDHAKAQGAIIGKAMSSLSEGRGMVLVLVSLQ